MLPLLGRFFVLATPGFFFSQSGPLGLALPLVTLVGLEPLPLVPLVGFLALAFVALGPLLIRFGHVQPLAQLAGSSVRPARNGTAIREPKTGLICPAMSRQAADQPPSEVTMAPFTFDASSEASQEITVAIWSG